MKIWKEIFSCLKSEQIYQFFLWLCLRSRSSWRGPDKNNLIRAAGGFPVKYFVENISSPGAGQGGGRVQRVGGARLPGSVSSKGGVDLSEGYFYLSRILLCHIYPEYYQQCDGCHERITQKTVVGQRRELFAPLPIIYPWYQWYLPGQKYQYEPSLTFLRLAILLWAGQVLFCCSRAKEKSLTL